MSNPALLVPRIEMQTACQRTQTTNIASLRGSGQCGLRPSVHTMPCGQFANGIVNATRHRTELDLNQPIRHVGFRYVK